MSSAFKAGFGKTTNVMLQSAYLTVYRNMALRFHGVYVVVFLYQYTLDKQIQLTEHLVQPQELNIKCSIFPLTTERRFINLVTQTYLS